MLFLMNSPSAALLDSFKSVSGQSEGGQKHEEVTTGFRPGNTETEVRENGGPERTPDSYHTVDSAI